MSLEGIDMLKPLTPDQIAVKEAVRKIRRIVRDLVVPVQDDVDEQCDTIDRIVLGPKLVVDDKSADQR